MSDKTKKKFYKNEKFQKVFFPVLYFFCAVVLITSAVFSFERNYYETIWVSGASMNPTLIGEAAEGGLGRSHYGKLDKSRRELEHLKRFDVIITHYPKEWYYDEGSYIIKRLWAFPGETINLEKVDNEMVYTVSKNEKVIATYKGVDTSEYFSFNVGNKTFNTMNKVRTISNFTLRDDEYFVMGDNWRNSLDSYTNIFEHHRTTQYVTFNHLQGRVVQIVGTARIDNNGNIYDKQEIRGMFEF